MAVHCPGVRLPASIPVWAGEAAALLSSQGRGAGARGPD